MTDGTDQEQGSTTRNASRADMRKRAGQQQSEQHSAPSPEMIHDAIREEGEDELSHPWHAVAWSGLAAGLAMGLSLLAQALLRAHLPDEPWQPLIFRLGYSVGFVIVILARHQLYTENTLTLFFPVIESPTRERVRQTLRLACIVLVTNLAGALAFAWVIANTGVFAPHIRHEFHELGRHAIEGDSGTVLLEAVFAGWLIGLIGWVLPYAGSARVLVIVLLAYLVGLSGLSHIVAGSVETLYLVTTGAASWQQYAAWMAPTLVGNTIGGCVLAAALNRGQVRSPQATEQADEDPGPS